MAAAANRKAKHSKLDPVHINVGLQQVYPDPEEPSLSRDLTLDIVAIPGLGANPEWTWVRDKVHWLRDSTMLGRKIPNARISVFQYQSQWFGKGSVDQQLDNVVDQLLYQLKRTRGVCLNPL
ncbi:hypothetical protein BU24DRAFT_127423 [Aaosphaeria arxii CBS 175.79]|uniref:Uncharacterized protein n=1 Tax=Aaosphaeria arxii CBS 175.79 TaxID=1450172 RepID=A0A6A5Y2N6_9PLEO|nr:uncharacterized protein BU24DRAFT_127423 [Aaosphaeria arxii CBS 175.79]KAF2019802.1 hypothetical protein BU24DRAFT_127423 [Aaosphaeria arxii CBS 175.79]